MASCFITFEISAPPPFGFLIGIYKFYENWSTETFRKKESKKWTGCNTVYSSYRTSKIYLRFPIEIDKEGRAV